MLLMLVISGVIGYAIYENTLSEWWIPVGVALMIAVVTFPFYMKWAWLTNNNDKLVNLGCHLVCVGVMSYALFLAGNYWLADPASEQKEEVIVQKKYQKTHQKRRGTRRRYKSVGVRKEYYLEVAFANGTMKTLHVSLSTYNKTRQGGTKILTLQNGFFGLPVIRKRL
ncbi:MAG: hypothetical protein NC410_08530 [Oscillibacter sp.]|nr:hypothetical protein [Oscillibacter sp.]